MKKMGTGIAARWSALIHGKHTMLWMIFFVFMASINAFAQAQPGTVCADAQLMAQWWSWIGAGWGAGILLGVFSANPIGAGLIGASVVTLQIIGYYGGAMRIC